MDCRKYGSRFWPHLTKRKSGRWYSAYYDFENNVLKRLQIMRRLGYSEQEILEYRQKFKHFSAIRKMEMEEYQIFQCFQSNLNYIQLLKDVCADGEWISYCVKILKAKTAAGIRRELLFQEGLYQQLLEDIQKNGHLHDLNQYEKNLKKRYSIEVRDIYVDFICKEAKYVADRKHYKELKKYLKKIASYPDGKKKVQEISEAWRTLYKRRRSMMEELEKAVNRIDKKITLDII